jgi:hypothetical protein
VPDGGWVRTRTPSPVTTPEQICLGAGRWTVAGAACADITGANVSAPALSAIRAAIRRNIVRLLRVVWCVPNHV